MGNRQSYWGQEATSGVRKEESHDQQICPEAEGRAMQSQGLWKVTDRLGLGWTSASEISSSCASELTFQLAEHLSSQPHKVYLYTWPLKPYDESQTKHRRLRLLGRLITTVAGYIVSCELTCGAKF